MNLSHYACTKINSKWIRYLNVRHETIKLEENIRSKVFDISLSNIFLGLFPQGREIKVKFFNWDYNKLKSYCTVKETINQMEIPTNEWEKILANDIFVRWLVQKI